MRIAIVGAGISGLVCGHLLHGSHDIRIFEANDYIGGHTNTVTVDTGGTQTAVDTGFIVYNDRNYPNFCRILDQIGIEGRPTSMSFSVQCKASGLEYNGSSLNGLFAQRRNLLRPWYYRLIGDILRFNREAESSLKELDDTITVGAFLRDRGFSQQFSRYYLLPMGAAIWSCPAESFEQFPVRFIITFYRNHGLLQLRDRPTWHVVEGGSKEYVNALTAPFRDRIHLDSPVRSVQRSSDSVAVSRDDHPPQQFDEVIFACHSDQALGLLDAPDGLERTVLETFRYGANTAVLHTDKTVLPQNRRAWASWNYRVGDDPSERPAVTYNMNILQHIRSDDTFCVSLNDESRIDPDRVLGQFQYDHPVFTTGRASAQDRHPELIRRHRTSFCGAYWGNGFHEDGVNSALTVCREFGAELEHARTSQGQPNTGP